MRIAVLSSSVRPEPDDTWRKIRGQRLATKAASCIMTTGVSTIAVWNNGGSMLSPWYLVVATALVGTLGEGSAWAGPCTVEIDRFEAAVQALGSDAAHQSPSARLDRQPTPASVAKARRDAMAEREHHRQVVQRARAADASGDRAGCLKALEEAGHDRWTTERSPARLRKRSQ